MNGPQGRTLGSYRISKELSATGGRAYDAEDVASGTPVILRFPPPETPPELWQETRRLGRLAGLGLPVILEVGESDEGPFVAFSPPAGRSLTRFVAEGGQLSREELVRWLRTALDLLAEVHVENVLHRNLGPEAVVISSGGQLGLTGFSLTGLTPPAPELQSPEQRAGKELSPASDLYSLAALFRRLAQPVALGGASSGDFSVDDPLAAVFAQAMSQEPWDRYRDVAEMEAAVRRAEEVSQGSGPEFGTVAMQAGALQELLSKEASAAQGAASTDPEAGKEDLEPVEEKAVAEDPQAGIVTPAEPVPPPRGPAPPATSPESSSPAPVSPAAPATSPKKSSPAPASPPAAPPAARAEAGFAMGGGRKRGFPWAAVLLLLAVGAGAFLWLQTRDDGAGTPPPAPITAEDVSPTSSPGRPTSGDESSGESTRESAGEAETGAGAVSAAVAGGADDPALELARLLLSDGEALFGEAQLAPEDEEILTQVQDDIDDVDFEGDPRGNEPVRSLFGENPLLARANPLIDAGMRRRWLADAIHATGTEHSLAHLREETERLRRGEVSRAEWYAHVAACREFCNRVVSGLIYEHVQQVRGRPNLLLLFETASAALTPSRQEALEAFLSGQGAATHVLLIGRASRSGDREYNRRLSMDRVGSARRAVLSLGIDGDRINAFGLGYEPPQLTPELARIYGLRDDLSLDELNQSVLVVAYKPT